jgi:hypothetical protein
LGVLQDGEVIFADGFEPHVNVAPQIASDDGDATLPENTARTIRFQIIDPDVATDQSVQVTLEVDNGATFSLPILTGLNFTIGDGQDDGIAVFEGTLAAVNNALASGIAGVRITPVQDLPGDVTLSALVSDLGNSGEGGPKTDSATWLTTYAETNTAPTIVSDDGLDTLAVNTARTVRFQVADPDVTSGQNVQVALAVDSGASLALPVRTGLTFSIGGGQGGETAVQFQGTLAAVNDALASGGGGVQIVPAAAFVGDLTLSCLVSDLGNSGIGGAKTASATWATTYANGNSAPTISAIADRSIVMNTPGGDSANFTVDDGQTLPGNLEVSASVAYDVLDPVQVELFLGGSGSSRTITAVPAPDDHGKVTITVTVSDGVLVAAEAYLLTVTVE